MASKYESAVGSRFEWINRFLLVISSVDRSCFVATGMKSTQGRILFHIALFPNKPIGNVATSLSLKASTTTAAFDVLEKKGLAKRSHLSGDRRNVCVDITEDGLKLLTQLIPLVKSSLDNFTKDVSEDLYASLLHYVSGTNPKPNDEYSEAFDALVKRMNTLELDVDEQILKDYFDLRFQAFENVCCYNAKLAILNRKAGITPNEARILRTVAYYSTPITIKNITQQIRIRPNVATVSIYGLLDKGLVIRDVNPNDRRSATIALTQEGKKLVGNHVQIYNQLFDDYFPGLSKLHLKEFHKVD